MNENNSPFMFALSVQMGLFYASHSVESITYSGPNGRVYSLAFIMPNTGLLVMILSTQFCLLSYFLINRGCRQFYHTASIVNWNLLIHMYCHSTDFSPQTSVQDVEVYEKCKTFD